ncbi:MAG: hypothetical protein HY677_00625 [Chloroflexi bacterium]|nr:hypothetical protein [Chloroflexota bacterium]
MALFLFLVLISPTGSPLARKPIERIAEPYMYSLLVWEASHFPSKWLQAARDFLRGDRPSQQEQVRLVREYFALSEEISSLQAAIKRAAILQVNQSMADVGEMKARLKRLLRQRDQRKPAAEAALESQLTSVLKDEGLMSSLRLPSLKLVFPPVDFALQTPPRVLIVSPRERIEMQKAITLRPGLDTQSVETIESQVEKLGLSAVVEETGGFSTYPTSIPDGYQLRTTLESVAHEWIHTYLAFRPLGRHYGDNGDLRTMNETVANIAGDEIGWLVYTRYYDRNAPSPQELRARQRAQKPEPGAFDFNAEMRTTRLTVDAMLAEGRVDDAEAYMRERQRDLAEHGYFIRKLNQAYFAFHGAYADVPSATSPIGEDLRRLRQIETSVGDFVKRVQRFSRLDQLQQAVAEAY